MTKSVAPFFSWLTLALSVVAAGCSSSSDSLSDARVSPDDSTVIAVDARPVDAAAVDARPVDAHVIDGGAIDSRKGEPDARADAAVPADAQPPDAASPDANPALPTWIHNSPQTSPPARQNVAMAYDALHGVTVIFGGIASDSNGNQINYSDTWTWDGSIWTQLSPVHSPPASQSLMVYDSQRQEIVLVSTSQSDTWLWDGSDWTDTGAAAPSSFET